LNRAFATGEHRVWLGSREQRALLRLPRPPIRSRFRRGVLQPKNKAKNRLQRAFCSLETHLNPLTPAGCSGPTPNSGLPVGATAKKALARPHDNRAWSSETDHSNLLCSSSIRRLIRIRACSESRFRSTSCKRPPYSLMADRMKRRWPL
jgi:hypothetical protein